MNALTNLEPRNLDEAMRFSELLANSELVPAQFKGKPGNVLVAIQWGREVGLSPMQALQNIAVINGRPSIWGDAALALVRGSPVCEDVIEVIEGEGDNAVAICEARRKGAAPVVRRFSVADARKAGLWAKSGPWQSYPQRMLSQRARGFALRDAFPDVLKGVITTEEAQDIPREPIDVTPPREMPRLSEHRGQMQARSTPPHDPETGEIHEAQFAPGPTAADLEIRFTNYAIEGMERLETEWKALTTEQRVALGAGRGTSGPKMAHWKTIAASVDGKRQGSQAGGSSADSAAGGVALGGVSSQPTLQAPADEPHEPVAEPSLSSQASAETPQPDSFADMFGNADDAWCSATLTRIQACATLDASIALRQDEMFKARMSKLPQEMWRAVEVALGQREKELRAAEMAK